MEDSSTRCLAVTADGICGGWAIEESPINLCVEHLRTAHNFAVGHPEFIYDRTVVKTKCPTCFSAGMYYYSPIAPTIHCDNCGAQWKRNLNRTSKLEYVAPSSRRRTNKSISPSTPMVYYIEHGGQVKIGTSIDWHRRLGSLPHDRILALEPGGREVEQKRHSQFSRSRVRRTEWFNVTDELANHIETVRASHPEFTEEVNEHNAKRIA